MALTPVHDGAGSRRYDNTARQMQVAQTRDRIVSAGAELAHQSASWDWEALTFRAVAERAGVGERTVYRHFPSERHLHDAVMQRLEEEAGITYENVDLANLTEVTARVFGTRGAFAAAVVVAEPVAPTFMVVDERRRRALSNAVAASTPTWSDRERETVAALLDVLWNLPAYERLVTIWHLDPATATGAITWLMDKVVEAIEGDDPPPTVAPRARRGRRTGP